MRAGRTLLVAFAAIFLTFPGHAANPQPRFEVASIRRCAAPQGHYGGTVSAGRIEINCFSVKNLIARAYVRFANGKLNPPSDGPIVIEGGPGWADSDLYTITAKAEGTPLFGTMSGPMLQALLEDRFKLRLHHRPTEIPVYALTVSKTGARLTPAKEACVADDPDHRPPTRPQGQPALPVCDQPAYTDHGVNLLGATLDQLSRVLSPKLRRPVVNNTGVQGHFDFCLDYGGQPPPETDRGEAALDQVRAVLGKLG